MNMSLFQCAYVLVIAQPECNMPYIALEQYNARRACRPEGIMSSSAIYGMLHEGACNN